MQLDIRQSKQQSQEKELSMKEKNLERERRNFETEKRFRAREHDQDRMIKLCILS